jgi:hypothetical protein
MVQIELPHVNVLSKIDIIEQYGKLGISIVFVQIHTETMRYHYFDQQQVLCVSFVSFTIMYYFNIF